MQVIDQMTLHRQPSMHTDSAVNAYVLLIDIALMTYRDAMCPLSCILACCAGCTSCAYAQIGTNWLQATCCPELMMNLQMKLDSKPECDSAGHALLAARSSAASPTHQATHGQPDGNATRGQQPERELAHVGVAIVPRHGDGARTACSQSCAPPSACASCSRASLPVRIGRRLERSTRTLRHGTATGHGNGHRSSTGRQLDPAAHAFLMEVALSVPSCPAAMQRAQPQVLGTLAAVQRPGSGPPSGTKCKPAPDVAGGIRELQFALRAADHCGRKQQLRYTHAAAPCGGVD